MGKRKVAQEWLTRFVLIIAGITMAAGIVVLVAPYIVREGNTRYANVNLGEVERWVPSSAHVVRPPAGRPGAFQACVRTHSIWWPG